MTLPCALFKIKIPGRHKYGEAKARRSEKHYGIHMVKENVKFIRSAFAPKEKI